MAFEDKGFMGEGTANIAIRDTSDVLGKWERVGNVTLMNIENAPDVKERISLQQGTAGQALDTVYRATPIKVKLEFDTASKAAFAAALAATLISDDNVVAGTASAEPHFAYHDAMIRLENRHTSALVLSTPVAGTGTLYTSDTAGYAIGDTVINLITGTGTILSGDTITYAGDTNLYVVDVGNTGAGPITLKSGLKQALPASAVAMSIRAAIATLSAVTDYTIDSLNNQMIDILSTGVIADGGPVLAAYSYSAATRDTFYGGTPSLRIALEILGVNATDSKGYVVYIGALTIASSTAFDFIGSDFAALSLEGTASIDRYAGSPSFGLPWKASVNEVATA